MHRVTQRNDFSSTDHCGHKLSAVLLSAKPNLQHLLHEGHFLAIFCPGIINPILGLQNRHKYLLSLVECDSPSVECIKGTRREYEKYSTELELVKMLGIT